MTRYDLIRRVFLSLYFVTLPLACTKASATERLILIGGGEFPPAAMAQMVEWGGGTKANVLVFAWATESPQSSFEYLKEKVSPYKPAVVDMAPIPGAPGFDANDVVKKVQSATAIFFSGGDQVFAMERINKLPEVRSALVRRFKEGVVFGGNSAGTAMMSATMLTGGGDFSVIEKGKVETASGLGMIKNVVIDQHFLKRQRLNRLISVLITSHERLALGIDEDTAVAIEDSKWGKVLGDSKVVRLHETAAGEIKMNLLKPGDEFTL